MLRQALGFGIPVSEFWAMNVPETQMAMQAAEQREERADEDRAWLAWHIAAFTRSKTMPSLNVALGRNKTRMLTPDEATARQAEMQEMAARMGVPIVGDRSPRNRVRRNTS